MERSRHDWGADERTHRNQMYLDALQSKLSAYAADERLMARRSRHHCRFCTYIDDHIAGQALTKWQCARCEVWDMYSDTGVPLLCLSCAQESHRCAQCGAMMD